MNQLADQLVELINLNTMTLPSLNASNSLKWIYRVEHVALYVLKGNFLLIIYIAI